MHPVLWIRIRIDLALLNPDPAPYWECGSGSGSRSKEQGKLPTLTNKPVLQHFKGFCTYLGMFYDMFQVKIQLCVRAKPIQNPNPEPYGPALAQAP
jgi:hypothetical protein